nr:MAG TPA: AAA domain protein [Caudoviricetes sp.]
MNITRGRQAKAQRVIIYGTEGIGKSTLASQFPNPLFIDTEGSTSNMDVARMDKPTSWIMLMNQIAFVKANPTVCDTLIVDTIDWAEALATEFVCSLHGKVGVEDFGYGNGYTYVREEFGRFLNKLQEIVDLGIHVVLTAHAQIRKFEQPDEFGSYDRYELKLGKKTTSQTAPLVKEWGDIILFCNYKTIVMKNESKKNKAQGGQRVMYTTHTPSWDAKNRFGLPEELPMEYQAIAHIFNKQHKQVAPQAQTVQTVQQAQPVQQAQQVQPVAEPTATPVAPSTPVVEEVPQDPFIELSTLELPEILPQALRDLMRQNSVTTEELQLMASNRGHFPMGTPIENFPKEYWDVVVANWETSMQEINQHRTL